MRALVARGIGSAELVEDHPRYEPGAGWARIRMLRAGICGTDLELLEGYKGGFEGVLGHEFVGVVELCPSDRSIEGRRVVGDINVSCGECADCRRGHRSHCERRSVLGILNLDGTFAESLLLPVENLHFVPDSIDDDIAVFTEPLASAVEILEHVHILPTSSVYVLGAGRLGLLVSQVLRLTGAELTLVGRHPEWLVHASSWGLRTVLNHGPAAPDLPPSDVVVDCTGVPAGLQHAITLVRPLGTIVFKSTFHGGAEWQHNNIVINEVRIVGSRCGPFDPALRLLERGLVQVRPLIDAVYPLRDGLAALEHAARPGVVKVLLANDA